jgi:streptogramin lyase
MLFVANWDSSNVQEYPLQGGNGSPKVTLSTDILQPQGLVFDSAGNLWVANAVSVVEFSRGELAKPSATPVKVIQSQGFKYAGIAFDSSGDLWADDYGGISVVEYTKSQLSASGSPTPTVVLTSDNLSEPFGLAFDRSGDLWVGNEGNGQVLEYAKSELNRSGSPVPKLDLSVGSNAEEVAFDSQGNLWTTDAGNVLGFTKAELTKPSAQPAISITPGLSSPGGLAFTASGNLWVTDYSGEAVAELTKAQLQAGGTVTAARTISDSGGPVAVAIGP